MSLCTGETSDAAEVLTALYDHLALVADRAALPQLLTGIFGLSVQVVSTVP